MPETPLDAEPAPIEHGQQFPEVVEVQPGGRLVEDVNGAAGVRPGQFGGEGLRFLSARRKNQNGSEVFGERLGHPLTRQLVGPLARLLCGIIGHFGLRPSALVKSLSRGERAGLCLALTLAPEPELLILDDPAMGLDRRQQLAQLRLRRQRLEHHLHRAAAGQPGHDTRGVILRTR